MADQYDFSDFDDKKEDELDFSDFEETPEVLGEKPSQLETLGRGAVQGVTMGLGEEIGAAALTPFAKLLQYIPGTPENVDRQLREQGFKGEAIQEKSIIDTYKELRDTAREADKSAKEAHGGTYMAGEILGGIAPAIASGGTSAVANVGKTGLKQAMKEGAKAGLKVGAVEGYGLSEGDTIGEDIQNTLEGAALGGAAGGILPVATKGVKSIVGKLTKKAEKARNFLDDQGSILSKIQRAYSKKKKDPSSVIFGMNKLDQDLKFMSEEIQDLLPSSKKITDKIGKQIDSIVKKAQKSVDVTEDLKKLHKDISKKAKDAISSEEQDQLQRLSQKPYDLLQKSGTITKDEAIDSAMEKAIVKRRNLIEDLKSKESTILNKELAEFTEPVFDEAGNRVSFRNLVTGKTTSIPVKKGTAVEEILPTKLQATELKKAASDVGKRIGDYDRGEASRSASEIFSTYKNKIREAIGDNLTVKQYDTLNKQYNTIKTIFDVLQPNLNSLDKVARQKAERSLANIADRFQDQNNMSSRRLFNDFFNEMEKIDPTWSKQHKDKILNLSEDIDLNLTAMGVDPTQATSLARLVGSIGSFGVRAGAGLGKVVGKTSSMINKVKNIPKEGLINLSQRTKNPKTANFLKNLAEKDDRRKAALLFSASQNKEMREELKKILGEDEE